MDTNPREPWEAPGTPGNNTKQWIDTILTKL